MSSFYHYNAHQQHPTTQTHAGRSRRAPRLSTSQNSHKQFRGVRSMKELTDTASITTFRLKFEAGRSFDLDDDMEFCPALLTQDDIQSIHSASDRSSLSSGSPESSPTQHVQHVAPAFALNSASNPYIPAGYPASIKVHQPTPARVRSAIPIVNPNTRMSSPPTSVSPSRMQQQQHQQQASNRRW